MDRIWVLDEEIVPAKWLQPLPQPLFPGEPRTCPNGSWSAPGRALQSTLNKKTCLLVDQEDTFSCSTRRRAFLLNKKTCLLKTCLLVQIGLQGSTRGRPGAVWTGPGFSREKWLRKWLEPLCQSNFLIQNLDSVQNDPELARGVVLASQDRSTVSTPYGPPLFQFDQRAV